MQHSPPLRPARRALVQTMGKATLSMALSMALLVAALLASGCAATQPIQPKAAQPATAPGKTAQAEAEAAERMTARGRSAAATPPPATAASIAPEFYSCIDARRGLGAVKLGMSVREVRAAAPWLDIDPLNSELLSRDILTFCGERVWDYKVRFDADCRVRSVWFTGPQRLERVFESICPQQDEPESSETAFKWHCSGPGSRLTITEHGPQLNVYHLFRLSQPQSATGRCLLPKYWE